MTYEEELVFGLKRWIYKAAKYLDQREMEEFFKDEKSFDACCYCLEVISDIATRILENDNLITKFDTIDFQFISTANKYPLKDDNMNLNAYYELFASYLPKIYNEIVKIEKEDK